MKNQHDDQLAIQLGRILALHIEQSDFRDEIDLVLPVPINGWRRLKRGFNGAAVIAESVADACRIPVSAKALRCLRRTKKQGTLSTSGRFKNVRNAFGLHRRVSVTGLTIMLIDDVMTSGATTSEAASLLLKEGANKVYVGIIARGARVS